MVMRLGWLSFAATSLAASFVSMGGCSSFTAADDTDGGDAGNGAAETGPAACTAVTTPSKPAACTACAPDKHFGTMGFDTAFVAGATAYALSASDETIFTAGTAGTDVFKSSKQIIRGIPQSLLADDQWLYVSTSQRVVRAQLTNLKMQEQLVDLSASMASGYRTALGRTFLYRLEANSSGTTSVFKRTKVMGGTESKTDVSLASFAFAVDGDTAYYVPRRVAANPSATLVTKLEDSSTHGPALPADAVALAVRFPFAYVAYVSGSNTEIVRLPIDDQPNPAIVPLVHEAGIISTFAIDGDHMYWSSSRGGGLNAVATADLCGGDARDIGQDVTPFGQFSFDADYVYGGGNAPGAMGASQPMVRFPKK